MDKWQEYKKLALRKEKAQGFDLEANPAYKAAYSSICGQMAELENEFLNEAFYIPLDKFDLSEKQMIVMSLAQSIGVAVHIKDLDSWQMLCRCLLQSISKF